MIEAHYLGGLKATSQRGDGVELEFTTKRVERTNGPPWTDDYRVKLYLSSDEVQRLLKLMEAAK